MIEALLNFLIQCVFFIISLIGSLFIYPIQAIFVTIFPDLGQSVSVMNGFFTEYLFPILGFIKELFLDLSCCPRSLWSLFITFLFARWAVAPAVRSIKLILNIWKIKSGSVTE